jgi:uncharacterized protein (TIGR02118 family)
MIKASVMCANDEGSTFDMTYYSGSRTPMVRQKLGAALKGVAVDQGIGGEEPGSPAPYLAVAHPLFESVGGFQTSLGPRAQEFEDDIPNYTDT